MKRIFMDKEQFHMEMMIKGILIICLVLMMGSGLRLQVSAETSIVAQGNCGADSEGENVTWKLTSDGTLTLKGQGKMKTYDNIYLDVDKVDWSKSYEINGEVYLDDYQDANGDPFILFLGVPWFDYRKSIRKIVVEEGITNVGMGAFYFLKSVESVELPETLETIEDSGFSYCNSLTTCRLPLNLKKLDQNAFSHCAGLREITIPFQCTSLGLGSFFDCPALKKVEILSKVDEFPKDIFGRCTSLQEVRFHQSTPKTIHEKAFSQNTVKLSYREDNPPSAALMSAQYEYAEVSWVAYTPTEEDDWVISGSCGENSGIHWAMTCDYSLVFRGNGAIPDYMNAQGEIEEFPWNSFINRIQAVNIGGGITSIGSGALAHLEQTKSYVIPANVRSLGNDVFASPGEKPITKKIYFQGSMVRMKDGTFDNTVALAFYPATEISWLLADLTENYSNGNLTWIGYDPSRDMEEEELINYVNHGKCGENVLWQINDGTLYITGEGAMYDYKGKVDPFYKLRNYFTKIRVEKDITHIGSYAFDGCSNVEEVYIEDDVESMGEAAFRKCINLKKVHLPEDLEKIPDYLFEDCYSLKEINLPDNISIIGAHSLESCTSLTLVELPTHLVTINSYAFSDSIKLTIESIPSTLQSIGPHAFDGCQAIDSLELAELVEIGPYAFANCTGLMEVVLGNDYSGENDTLSIGDYAFYGNEKLSSIDFGRNVKALGESAFSQCPNLKEVTLWDTVTSLGKEAIGFLREGVKTEGFVIYGTKPSNVADYATENDITFEVKEKAAEETDDYNLQEDQTLVVSTSYSSIKVGQSCWVWVSGNKTPLTFRSSKPSVASVSANGIVTGKKKGTVTITVTAIATKKYRKKTAKIKLQILKKSVKCLETVSRKESKATIRWDAYSGAKGYLIRYTSRKDFRKYKTIRIKKASQTSAKLKGLKKGKKYYVRIAATDGNGKRITDWKEIEIPK